MNYDITVFKRGSNMVSCPLVGGGEFEDPERLKRLVYHTHTATTVVLERLITFLGGENRFLQLRRDPLSPPEYRRRLVDIYVDELFTDGAAERERRRRAERAETDRLEEEAEDAERAEREEAERAAREAAERAAREAAEASLEGRPDRSRELQEELQKEPWECPICFCIFEDPNRIYVTCHRGENANLQYAQHKACDSCSLHLQRCHMCRAPGQRLPLSRAWNGFLPLTMRMGGNPFLVGDIPRWT
jgi:hypothetical protein